MTLRLVDIDDAHESERSELGLVRAEVARMTQECKRLREQQDAMMKTFEDQVLMLTSIVGEHEWKLRQLGPNRPAGRRRQPVRPVSG